MAENHYTLTVKVKKKQSTSRYKPAEQIKEIIRNSLTPDRMIMNPRDYEDLLRTFAPYITQMEEFINEEDRSRWTASAEL